MKGAVLAAVRGPMPVPLRPIFIVSAIIGIITLLGSLAVLPWIAGAWYRAATFVPASDHAVEELGAAVDNMVVGLFVVLAFIVCLPHLVSALAVIYRKRALFWSALVLNFTAALLEFEIAFIADTTRKGSPIKIAMAVLALLSTAIVAVFVMPRVKSYLSRKEAA